MLFFSKSHTSGCNIHATSLFPLTLPSLSLRKHKTLAILASFSESQEWLAIWGQGVSLRTPQISTLLVFSSIFSFLIPITERGLQIQKKENEINYWNLLNSSVQLCRYTNKINLNEKGPCTSTMKGTLEPAFSMAFLILISPQSSSRAAGTCI